MASADLKQLKCHIKEKISTVKKTVQLRNVAAGNDAFLKSVVARIREKIFHVYDLLTKLEAEVQQQEKLNRMLKVLQKEAGRHQNEAKHLLENVSPCLRKLTYMCAAGPVVKCEEQAQSVEPKRARNSAKEANPIKRVTFLIPKEFESVPAAAGPVVKCEEQAQSVEPKRARNSAKETKPIKQVAFVTPEEFESIPAYMKGCLKHDMINVVVREINNAVLVKYTLLQQPVRHMNLAARNVYHRHLHGETKDTKGEFFVMESDIKEFTQMKLDKRFYSIITVLRRCKRVREVHEAKLVRYIIC